MVILVGKVLEGHKRGGVGGSWKVKEVWEGWDGLEGVFWILYVWGGCGWMGPERLKRLWMVILVGKVLEGHKGGGAVGSWKGKEVWDGCVGFVGSLKRRGSKDGWVGWVPKA